MLTPKLKGRVGQYSTIEEHMPENHKKYIAWNSERFISWARRKNNKLTRLIRKSQFSISDACVENIEYQC